MAYTIYRPVLAGVRTSGFFRDDEQKERARKVGLRKAHAARRVPFTCPACGRVCLGASGLARHRASTHGKGAV